MPNLNPITPIPKNGTEPFLQHNKNTSMNLLDFWKWSQSDLLSNTLRGVLAEFIVKMDLGIESSVRTEWDSYDLLTEDGIKIEVKSAAYLQSWKQEKLSNISFSIAPTKGWDAKTNEYSTKLARHSDYYVFCLLDHKEKETVNPMDLDQWVFYVIATKELDEKLSNQKTITLSSLKTLNPGLCKFGSIKNFII